MGVSVRVSRNARVYLPFWIAIPAYLLASIPGQIIELRSSAFSVAGTGSAGGARPTRGWVFGGRRTRRR